MKKKHVTTLGAMLFLGGGLLILFLCGCSPKSYVVRDIDGACAHAKVLAGEDLSDMIPETLIPFWIRAVPPVFIEVNAGVDSLLCAILNRDKGILQRFAYKGNGPLEYQNPYISEASYTKDGVAFSLLEKQRGRLDRYVYSIQENRVKLEESLSFPQEIRMVRHLFRTDRGYIGILDNQQQTIFTADKELKDIEKHPYKELEVEMTQNESQYFHSMMCVSPDGTQAALSYFRLPRIDILDSGGETRQVCYYGKRLQVQDIDKHNAKYYFGAIECDNDNIYVLYEGAGNAQVVKMTWRGEIVDVYNTPVTTFSIADGSMYALKLGEEKNTFIRYDMR